MKLTIEPMELEDISQVLEVDRESYTLPWPANAYRREVLHNRNARYFVMRLLSDGEQSAPRESQDANNSRPALPFFRWPGKSGERATKPGKIIGYAGMWMMVDEAHITTIAVRNEWRGKGLGELLLVSLLDAADGAGADRVTLEVRVSNVTAQNLYRKYGFRTEGIRRRYYSDNNEDAFIMTTDSVHGQQYIERYEQNLDQLRRRMDETIDGEVDAPALGVPSPEA